MTDEAGAPPRIHGAIARAIGIEIVSGKRAPGSMFGGEIEASEELGVSRTVYREAMRMLAAKGLIESRPKAGTRVTPRTRWNLLDPDILAWTFESEPQPEFIHGLFELREIIEPAAAAYAAERRSSEQLKHLREALDEMAHFGLADPQGRAADQRFHRALLDASGNEPLAALASTIGAAVQWTTIFKQRERPLPRDPVPDHEAVYKAIAAKDCNRARAAMLALVRSALEDTELSL